MAALPVRPLRAFSALCLALALAALVGLASARAQALPTSTLDIVTAAGKTYRFEVEIAATEETRAHGLMGRDSLAPDAGMLFEFPESAVEAFWMKDTLIPLDMLFIDKTGRIVHIAERAVPYDETPISSVVPVTGVLELNGGTVDRLKIRDGDRVVQSFFKP